MKLISDMSIIETTGQKRRLVSFLESRLAEVARDKKLTENHRIYVMILCFTITSDSFAQWTTEEQYIQTKMTR